MLTLLSPFGPCGRDGETPERLPPCLSQNILRMTSVRPLMHMVRPVSPRNEPHYKTMTRNCPDWHFFGPGFRKVSVSPAVLRLCQGVPRQGASRIPQGLGLLAGDNSTCGVHYATSPLLPHAQWRITSAFVFRWRTMHHPTSPTSLSAIGIAPLDFP